MAMLNPSEALPIDERYLTHSAYHGRYYLKDTYGDWCTPESPELIHSKIHPKTAGPVLSTTVYSLLNLMTDFAASMTNKILPNIKICSKIKMLQQRCFDADRQIDNNTVTANYFLVLGWFLRIRTASFR